MKKLEKLLELVRKLAHRQGAKAGTTEDTRRHIGSPKGTGAGSILQVDKNKELSKEAGRIKRRLNSFNTYPGR